MTTNNVLTKAKFLLFLGLVATCFTIIFFVSSPAINRKFFITRAAGINDVLEDGVLKNIVSEYVNKSIVLTKKPSQINFLENYRSPCWMDKELKCFANFFIAGFPKCGTTDIWNQLVKHPKIAGKVADEKKEPQWWSKTRLPHWSRTVSFDEHVTRYRGEVGKDSLIGNGSPQNLLEVRYINMQTQKEFNPPLSTEAFEALKNNKILPIHIVAQYYMPKLIVSIRNPTDVMYSRYIHEYTHHLKTSSKCKNIPAEAEFHASVRKEMENFQSCLITRDNNHHVCAYNRTIRDSSHKSWVHLQNGMYVYFLEDTLKIIPRENIKFVKFDEYKENRTVILDDIFQFLGLESDLNFVSKLVNDNDHVYGGRLSVYKTKGMWPETKQLLNDFFLPYNKLLADFMGDDYYLFQS